MRKVQMPMCSQLKSYPHEAIVEAHVDGELHEFMRLLGLGALHEHEEELTVHRTQDAAQLMCLKLLRGTTTASCRHDAATHISDRHRAPRDAAQDTHRRRVPRQPRGGHG